MNNIDLLASIERKGDHIKKLFLTFLIFIAIIPSLISCKKKSGVPVSINISTNQISEADIFVTKRKNDNEVKSLSKKSINLTRKSQTTNNNDSSTNETSTIVMEFHDRNKTSTWIKKEIVSNDALERNSDIVYGEDGKTIYQNITN